METLQELKNQYPGLFKQAKSEGYNEGHEAGVKEERDRVSALMVYNDVDSKKVAEKIESGEDFSKKEMAEIQKKMTMANFSQKAQAEANDPVDPGEAEASSEEEKEENQAWANIQNKLGIKENQ